MILSSRNLVAVSLSCLAFTGVIIACGSSSDSKFDDGSVNKGFFNEAGFDPDAFNNGQTIIRDDPPPGYCGPDAGADAATGVISVGGTEACPDDKNLPGCGCPTIGATAACWTGLRKNRELGICKDGTTTCNKLDETNNEWGPCNGEVLPKPDAVGGDGCNCFSVGEWVIANTAPCIWTDNGAYYAYSTIGPDAGGCTSADHLASGAKETAVWSTDTLKTDCAGSFTLCFRIKAGDYNNPQASDCELGESCVDVVYAQENVVQTLPDLPSWNSTDSTCAKKWESDTPDTTSPGYGEMYVKGGETVRCDAISSVPNTTEFIFNRVEYCPKACRPGYVPPAGEAPVDPSVCSACQLSGKGSF